MEKVWSFNTTLRNPERMEHMLRALSELEGVKFDTAGQEAFFGLQIKKRLYKPSKQTLQDADLINAVYFDTSADDINDALVEKILTKYRGRNVDGSGRGRTAAGILNRFGLCVALQSRGPIIITEFAKKWLNHEISDDELFTKFFLKWQYPNNIETGYNDFNIKPFIGTLALIRSVNQKWKMLGNKPVGLSKYEYMHFVPSLSKASQIEEYAREIISYRSKKESLSGVNQSNFNKTFSTARIQSIYGTTKDSKKAASDLRDYSDSSMRYFRTSGLVALRGGDTHFDIASDKIVEVESILKTVSPYATKFASYNAYFEYLSDIKTPALPWQNDDDLIKISTELSSALLSEAEGADINEYLSSVKGLSSTKKVESLKTSLNELRLRKLRNLKHDIRALDECIEKIGSITSKNYNTLTARPSLDLEWYVSRALMILNDAIEIAPSFRLGDDGIPTGFRPNISDIECYYSSFGMTVEVTLLLGRDQWIAEGQPVMRHFRDFEDKIKNDTAYCLFIAPLIHRDTLNTFWMGNKFSYEGKRQNIIPLTLTQFVKILKIAKEKIINKDLNNEILGQLFCSISDNISDIATPLEWLSTFPDTIAKW